MRRVRAASVFGHRLLPRQPSSVARLPQDTQADGVRTDRLNPVHWVIPELDADGQIDGHAAMCLRVAITEAVAVDAADILIDLRDLTALDEDAIALLRWAHDACRAHALHLDLLVGVRAPHDTLAQALTRAGLTTQPFVDRAGRIGAHAPVRGERLRLLREQDRDSRTARD